MRVQSPSANRLSSTLMWGSGVTLDMKSHRGSPLTLMWESSIVVFRTDALLSYKSQMTLQKICVLIPDSEFIFILYQARARTLHESLTGSEPCDSAWDSAKTLCAGKSTITLSCHENFPFYSNCLISSHKLCHDHTFTINNRVLVKNNIQITCTLIAWFVTFYVVY